MPKKIELKKVAKANPRVDLKKLREGIELTKKLRDSGFVKRGYDLPSPFGRKRLEIMENCPDDPRIIRLRG